MTSRYRHSLPFLIVVAGVLLFGAGVAQTQTPSSRTKTNTMVPVYDIAKEIKVQGTIAKIDGFVASGPIGTHILIQSAAGLVDAHLGFGPASSPKHLGLFVGESITVIGMMQTAGDTSVLMARILTTPSHIFVLRNEHGLPIRGTLRGGARPGTLYSALFAPGLSSDSGPGTLRGGL